LRQHRELTLLILTYYMSDAYNELKKDILQFFVSLESLAKTRGLPFVIKYVKDSRNSIYCSLSGSPLKIGDLAALNSRGWPVWLSSWERCTTKPEHLKVLMTLLVSLRSVKLSPVLDTESITRPSKSKNLLDSEISTALRLLGIGPITFEWTSFHMTVKSGPVGQALLMSASEATLFPVPDQWRAFKKFLKGAFPNGALLDNIILLGGSKLASRLTDLISPLDILPKTASQLWSNIYPLASKSLRRLSYFSDKEGKTRVIGLLDYWSQTCLKPLHDKLNFILRRLHSDCTFDQNKFVGLLRCKPIYYSIDLKAATDRMPITFQQKVLSFIIGAKKSSAWVSLLTDLPFTCEGKTYKYMAGQPMGAYSSWPAMALSHHVMVQVAYLNTVPVHLWPKLRSSFKDYALLGDDLVIANKHVAEKYLTILSRLDIEYSPAKTHISENFYEFAKRIFYNGEEITGFSVGGLMSVWKSYPLLLNFLRNQESHGYVLCLGQNFGSIIHSIHKLFRQNRYVFEHTERVVKLFMVFRELSKDKVTGDYSNTFSCITKLFGYSLPSNSDNLFYQKIVRAAQKKLFERDLPKIEASHLAVLNRLNKMVLDYVRAWPDQDQNTQTFLWETVPAMLIHNSPLLACLLDLISSYQKAFITEDYSAIEVLGMSKYFIGKSLFSMRRQDSIVLSQSALTKFILNEVKASQSELFIRQRHPNLEGNSIIYL